MTQHANGTDVGANHRRLWWIDLNQYIDDRTYRAKVDRVATLLGPGIDVETLTCDLIDGETVLSGMTCADEDGMPLPKVNPRDPLSARAHRPVQAVIDLKELP